MKKFRIVGVIEDSGSDDRRKHWVIEEKRWFRWSEISNNEGPKFRSVQHNSYKEAELYLYKHYTGHGVCKKYGNVYTFEYYTYYV